MIADLIGPTTPAGGLRLRTPAEPADSADTRATPQSPRLRTVADSCGRFHETRNVRKHPQASATPQNGATPSDPQNPQVPQPADAANAPDHSDLLAKLRRLAEAENLPPAIVDGLSDADLDPDNGAHLLDDAGLRRWLHVLAENARMRQGIAPPTWTQASYCHHCGPVRLWAGAPPHVIGCPWCHVRRAGGTVPRPALTCATCTHMRRLPQTSPAGMQSCKANHAMHYANEPHTCADWKPTDTTPDARHTPEPSPGASP